MCKNKILSIELDVKTIPYIYVWRSNMRNTGKYYKLNRVDNGFNGRRFVRGVKMAAALYGRQSGAEYIQHLGTMW
jgi:hypothetical protein